MIIIPGKIPMRTGPRGARKEAVIKPKVCVLASGSKGNCTYIESGGVRLLVDAGLTMRETKLRLGSIGVKPEELSAIIVTHEHIDHVRGVGPLSRKYGLPVYMTPKTCAAAYSAIGSRVAVREFEAGTPFYLDDIMVEPFNIPHDAADPVGLCVHAGGFKVGIATDLGYATALVSERLKGSHILLLESNHDPVMLKDGPYPWSLKQRVAGRSGHLSNADATEALAGLLHDGLSHVILAHLSQINNLPELAHDSAHEKLMECSFGHVRLGVASQDRVGEVIVPGL